jgi:molybdopterin converting factor subunit 1
LFLYSQDGVITVQITVLYFAALREQKGVGTEHIEVPPGTTVSELYATLFPPGPLGVLPVAFARNQTYATAGEAIEDGDEVAFLPPLGGG